MEIEFSHVNYDNLIDLSFKIPKSKIVGILGQDGDKLLKLISLELDSKGIIYFNKIRKLKRNYHMFRKDIILVSRDFDNYYNLDSIYEFFVYYIKSKNIRVDNIDKKIKDSVKILGLDSTIVNRRFSSLSSSEMKLIQLALAFLSNPKVILLDEPFKGLDLINLKKVIRILNRLQEKFKKTIVIYSKDSNIVYQYCNYLVVLNNGKVVGEGDPNDLFFESNIFEKYNIKRPPIVDFILLVKDKKNVKLPIRKDVKDVIKDIYWNVR